MHHRHHYLHISSTIANIYITTIANIIVAAAAAVVVVTLAVVINTNHSHGTTITALSDNKFMSSVNP